MIQCAELIVVIRVSIETVSAATRPLDVPYESSRPERVTLVAGYNAFGTALFTERAQISLVK